MNPDIERILDQLLHDRRQYDIVDWEPSLRTHLEDAWNFGYTTGAGDTYTTIAQLAAKGRDVSAIVTGIERVITWSQDARNDQEGKQ